MLVTTIQQYVNMDKARRIIAITFYFIKNLREKVIHRNSSIMEVKINHEEFQEICFQAR